MKTILMLSLLLALQSDGCGDTNAAKPAPKPPESGRQAMAVDGTSPGTLQRQNDGTYLLHQSNGQSSRVSANEVVLMPEEKR